MAIFKFYICQCGWIYQIYIHLLLTCLVNILENLSIYYVLMGLN